MEPRIRRTPRRPRGITLVEAATAVAIVGILAAIATPRLQSLIAARRLDAAATALAADLQFARVQAVARHEPVRVSFVPGARCWVVHMGDAVASCGVAGAIKSGAIDPAHRIAFAANAGSILFDPVLGTSTPTATLRVADPLGRELRHVVNVLGRVRTCTTDPALTAHRPC